MLIRRKSVLGLYTLLIMIAAACKTPQSNSEDISSVMPTEMKLSSTAIPTMLSTATQEAKAATSTKEIETRFDPATANQIAPEEFLQEVTYFGTGGDKRCPAPSYSGPTITIAPVDQELMIWSALFVCGWEEGEVLEGSILYPDGKITTQMIETELSRESYVGVLGIKTKITDPPGIYTFKMRGRGGTVEASAYFRVPDRPRLIHLDSNSIFLFGFTPQESVQLFYYDNDGKFGGWQAYQVNPDGQLTIQIPFAEQFKIPLYVAIGDQSGEVRISRDSYYGGASDFVVESSINKPSATCGGLPSRLVRGDEARVAYTDGSNMRIRAKPGFSKEILNKVPEGTLITVLDGPECADSTTWWKVRTESDIEGWMTEEQDGVYLLEPKS